jgi:hypothetical protein
MLISHQNKQPLNIEDQWCQSLYDATHHAIHGYSQTSSNKSSFKIKRLVKKFPAMIHCFVWFSWNGSQTLQIDFDQWESSRFKHFRMLFVFIYATKHWYRNKDFVGTRSCTYRGKGEPLYKMSTNTFKCWLIWRGRRLVLQHALSKQL